MGFNVACVTNLNAIWLSRHTEAVQTKNVASTNLLKKYSRIS